MQSLSLRIALPLLTLLLARTSAAQAANSGPGGFEQYLEYESPSSVNQRSPEDSGHRYALLVGIGDYPAESGLDPLYADRDADKLAEALRTNGWVVKVLNSYAPQQDQPYRDNILRALGIHLSEGGTPNYGPSYVSFLGASSLRSSDTVLFYYGGHGETAASDGVDYLIPRDGRIDKTDTLVNVNFVRTALEKTLAGHVIIFTDACRENTTTRGPDTTPRWKRRGATAEEEPGLTVSTVDASQHVYVQQSSIPGTPSYEMPEQTSGVFSYYVREALTKSPSSGQRCQTLKGVSDYARTNTVQYVQGRLLKSQTPPPDVPDWAGDFCMTASGASTSNPQESAAVIRKVLQQGWQFEYPFGGFEGDTSHWALQGLGVDDCTFKFQEVKTEKSLFYAPGYSQTVSVSAVPLKDLDESRLSLFRESPQATLYGVRLATLSRSIRFAGTTTRVYGNGPPPEITNSSESKNSALFMVGTKGDAELVANAFIALKGSCSQ